MAEFTGSFPQTGLPRVHEAVVRIFFGAAGPSDAQDSIQPQGNGMDLSQTSGGDGNGPSQKEDTEIVLSTDYAHGITYGLHRLDQLIDNFSVVNGSELYKDFSKYIATMKEVGGESWSPGYWDGIYETVIRVKTYEESQKPPKEILGEIREHYKDITHDTIHNTLPESVRMRRRKIIGMLAANFHPDSFFVKALPPKEQHEREEIFKTRISPSIVDDTIYGLVQLERIVREFGIAVD